MPVCPRGHTSEADDYCDECGLKMNGAAPPSAPVRAGSAAASAPSVPSSTSVAPAGGDDEVCPWCGTPRAGRFCEEDGYDFVLAPAGPSPSTPSAPSTPSTAAFASPVAAAPSSPPGASPSTPTATGTPAGWVLRIEADRRYFESTLARRGPDIGTVTFPTYYPNTEIALAGEEMRIGRRRASSAAQAPEIDLSGPPLDPGVSRLHAVLLAGEDGWSVLDPGSTNGTTINYADEPIATDTPVPVSDGDRIHVGAYTTLVVVRGDR